MRSSRRSSGVPALALALTLIACAVDGIAAHRLDEYLQAARIAIEPDRVKVELDLTPGSAVADRVLSLIDRDRNGTISDDEAQTYAAAVRDAIVLQIDGGALPIELVDSRFPAIEAAMRGEGTVRIDLSAAMPGLSPGAHRLVYRNTHRPDIGVYLANVLVPDSDRVAISAQRRDVDQRELAVDYVLKGDSSSPIDRWMLANVCIVLLVAAALWWRARAG